MATMQDIFPRTAKRDEAAIRERLLRFMARIDRTGVPHPALEEIEERYRQIAARCLDSQPGQHQSIAISSATRGEGASSVAIGIAIGASRNLGSDVLLLESEMQRPQLAQDFGTETMLGLSDYLSSDLALNSVIQKTRESKVWLMPAGLRTANPGPLIRSEKFEQLMDELHRSFATIIVDAPPLLTSPHASVIARRTSALVLVVRAGYTHIYDAAKAVKAAEGIPLRGVVLNRTRSWLPEWLTRLLGVSRFDVR